MSVAVQNDMKNQMTQKQKLLLCISILVPILFVIGLFYFIWIYMPYVCEQDVEKVKFFKLGNNQTVQERILSIENVGEVKWISGEFCPCAVVQMKNKGKVDLCFVIIDGVLYAKNDETIAVFPDLERTFKTMH
jgi:hypothetical protein